METLKFFSTVDFFINIRTRRRSSSPIDNQIESAEHDENFCVLLPGPVAGRRSP